MSVTHHYCTLFDKNYLYKGIAMYSSLQRVSDSFHLWVLAMDSETYTHLKKRGLPNVTVLSLNEVEDEELRDIKHTRSPAEYCWTLTPVLPLFIIEKYNVSQISYVDADLFFFS